MIEVLIIGFGFSAVPLIRELVATRTEFQVISEEGKSVWDGLSESGRLDFDLVSSYLTSFYSFDLVNDFERDFYPEVLKVSLKYKQGGENAVFFPQVNYNNA